MKQTGSALITALFIMTIVAIMAMAMALYLQISIRRSELLINTNKLYYSIGAVKYWASNLLLMDAKQQNNDIIFDQLPQDFTPTDVGLTLDNGIILQGKINDLQARFNINNLLDSNYIASFSQLIKIVIPSIDSSTAQQITDNITRALISKQHSGTGENNKSLIMVSSSNNPRLFASVTELRMIPGISPAILQQLLPYISALPETTAININTAPEQVLMCLGKGLSRDQVALIIRLRDSNNGFKSLAQFTSSPGIQALNIPAQETTVSSNYFLLQATARLGVQKLTLFDIINRTEANKKVQLTVLSESRDSI